MAACHRINALTRQARVHGSLCSQADGSILGTFDVDAGNAAPAIRSCLNWSDKWCCGLWYEEAPRQRDV